MCPAHGTSSKSRNKSKTQQVDMVTEGKEKDKKRGGVVKWIQTDKREPSMALQV
jgi:hypothetical protein